MCLFRGRLSVGCISEFSFPFLLSFFASFGGGGGQNSGGRVWMRMQGGLAN
jgi:hypothetical protein